MLSDSSKSGLSRRKQKKIYGDTSLEIFPQRFISGPARFTKAQKRSANLFNLAQWAVIECLLYARQKDDYEMFPNPQSPHTFPYTVSTVKIPSPALHCHQKWAHQLKHGLQTPSTGQGSSIYVVACAGTVPSLTLKSMPHPQKKQSFSKNLMHSWI